MFLLEFVSWCWRSTQPATGYFYNSGEILRKGLFTLQHEEKNQDIFQFSNKGQALLSAGSKVRAVPEGLLVFLPWPGPGF